MDTVFTDDAASCETYCSSVGDLQQGSVAWTYYTDGSNSCVCWESFYDYAGTEYSDDNTISGRFVDEGAPTTDNCGEKCLVVGWYSVISSVDSLDDCMVACEGYDGSKGMRYGVSNNQCASADSLVGDASWNADYISDIY